MKHNLTLATLTLEQTTAAKEANGKGKRITHALLCGPHGQIFGTETQCRKYWTAWNPARRPAIFPKLFDKAIETEECEITNFNTTFNLVNILLTRQGN